MRRELFIVVLAQAAFVGLASGQDGVPGPLVIPRTSVQAGQTPYASPVIEGLTPPTASYRESTSVDQPANEGWACSASKCFWVRGEYLLWWTKGGQLPVLVTTGVPGATLTPGVLGQPGTSVLFGGSDTDNPLRSGGRFTGGFWLNNSRTIGIEGSYFFLCSHSVNFDRVSTGAPGSAVIARPFFDTLTGTQDSQLVAFPGLASGEIHASSTSRLQGAELNMLCSPYCEGSAIVNMDCRRRGFRRKSLLAGFRYVQLDEDLGITETTRVNPVVGVAPGVFAGSPLFAGSTIRISDHFETRNYFYGPQVGGQAEFCWGRLSVNLLGKVALGVTHQVVDVRGGTTITSLGGATVATPTGFLASGSNRGRSTRDRFAVVPELGINMGYSLTSNLRVSVGYTFLYWSSVVRPGDQIDPGLNGTQLATDTRFNAQAVPGRPALPFADTDYWAQGINFGLEFNY